MAAPLHVGPHRMIQGDCLDILPTLAAGSVDMILADLPYGTTACAWDSVIPFDRLWPEMKRICRGRIVLTANQPFTTTLVASNLRGFRHAWTWVKNKAVGFQHAKHAPLKATEDVLVFQTGGYNPQDLVRINSTRRNGKTTGGVILRGSDGVNGQNAFKADTYVQEFTGYPRNILYFALDPKGFHPTQKPVALFEYLIRTYTDEGHTVLDVTSGSGTTAIAAERTGRRAICIERDPDYFDKSVDRLQAERGEALPTVSHLSRDTALPYTGGIFA